MHNSRPRWATWLTALTLSFEGTFVEGILLHKCVKSKLIVAAAEGWDVAPVLSVLAEVPCLAVWDMRKAIHECPGLDTTLGTTCVPMHQKIGAVDMSEAKLRYLENRPALLKFYRRPQ